MIFSCVMTGILVLYCVMLFWGPSWEAEGPKEGKELAERLIESRLLDRYLEFAPSIYPEANIRQRGDALGGLFGLRPFAPAWKVARTASGSSGHFTFVVSGWRRVQDSHRVSEHFVVHFAKREGAPIEITKIETWCPELRKEPLLAERDGAR